MTMARCICCGVWTSAPPIVPPTVLGGAQSVCWSCGNPGNGRPLQLQRRVIVHTACGSPAPASMKFGLAVCERCGEIPSEDTHGVIIDEPAA